MDRPPFRRTRSFHYRFGKSRMSVDHRRDILGKKFRVFGEEKLMNQLGRVKSGHVSTDYLSSVLLDEDFYDSLALFYRYGLTRAAIWER